MGAAAEVWENQRWYGIYWASPGLLERSPWSDADGCALNRPQQPSEETGWTPYKGPATGTDGWQYASVFKHFEYERPGGRASGRATDLVRRRRWRPVHPTSADLEAAITRPGTHQGDSSSGEGCGRGDDETRARNFISPASEMEGHSIRKQTEFEKRKAVVKLFMGMITATIKRNQVWNLLPLDPVAWLVMWNDHQEAFAHAVSESMCHRVPLESTDDLSPTKKQKQEEQQQEQQQEKPGEDQSGQSGSDTVSGRHYCQIDPPAMNQRQGRQLVQALLSAAMHSRAAYGYAMQAGHLTSVLNYALLHTVHSFSFDAAGGASRAANEEAMCALAGIAADDVIMADWHSSLSRPCHYVAIDRAQKAVVLSVRGSLEAGDIFSDISASPLEISFLGANGFVHEGLLKAATYVHSNTAAALAAAGRDFRGWPLYLTGHSMGGAVASLVALLLVEHGLPNGLSTLECFAIGPAAVMTAALADAARPYVTSVVLRSDFVPRLTYAGVESLLLELACSSPVRRAAQGVGQKFNAALETINETLKAGWATTTDTMPSTAPSRRPTTMCTDDSFAAAAAGLPDSDSPKEADQSGKASSSTAGRHSSSLPPKVSSAHSTGNTEGALARAQEMVQLAPSGDRHTDASSCTEPDSECVAPLSPSHPKADHAQSRQQQQQQKQQQPGHSLPDAVADNPGWAPRTTGGIKADAKRVEDLAGNAGTDPKRPEMLYVAGRVLWMIQPEEGQGGSHPEVTKGRLHDNSSARSAVNIDTNALSTPEEGDCGTGDGGSGIVHRKTEGTGSAASSSALTGPAPADMIAQARTLSPSITGIEEPTLEHVPSGRITGFGGGGDDSAMAGFGGDNRHCRASPPNIVGTAAAAARHKTVAAPIILDVDRRVFARMLLLPQTVEDHLPDAYLDALLNL